MDKNLHTQKSTLRRQAEERLASRPSTTRTLSQVDANRLIHELQVHQIELEMQNEEIKRTHAEIAVLLDKYTNLYDFSPVSYVVVHRDGTILQSNLAFERLAGIDRPQLLGRRLSLFVAMSDRPALNAVIEQAFAHHNRQVCEVELAREAGISAPAHVQIEATVLEDEMECRLVMVDITARWVTEKQLRDSEECHRVLLNTLAEGVVVLDDTVAVIMANPGAQQLMGLTTDQLMGRTAIDPRWSAVHEDGSPFPREMQPAFQTLHDGEPRNRVIIGIHQPDDSLTWVSVNTRRIHWWGAPARDGVVAIISDYGERKQAKEWRMAAEHNLHRSEIRLATLHALDAAIQRARAIELEAQVAARTAELQSTLDMMALAMHAGGVSTWEVDIATMNTKITSTSNEGPEHAPVLSISLDANRREVHPDDRHLLIEQRQRAVMSGKDETATFRRKGQDGLYHWYASRGRCEYDAQRNPTRLIGAAVDITELKDMEERVRVLFDAAPDPIVVFDQQWTMHDVNHAFETITGYTHDELIGYSLLSLSILVVGSTDELLRIREAIGQGMSAAPFELELRTKAGEQRVFEINLNPVTIYGGLLFMASYRDITERKHMEDRLYVLFLNSPDPIVLYDTNFELRDVNQAYETITGYKRAELLGRHPLDLGIITADQYERVSINVRDSLLQGQLVPPYEIVLHTKSGDPINLEVNIHTVTISGKLGFYASMRDIASRKQAEACLRKSV